MHKFETISHGEYSYKKGEAVVSKDSNTVYGHDVSQTNIDFVPQKDGSDIPIRDNKDFWKVQYIKIV